MMSFKKNTKLNRSFDAEEIIFESSVLATSSMADIKHQEGKLSRWTSLAPFLAILILSLLFGGRIYALQFNDEKNLVSTAEDNLFQIQQVVADRGEVYDRNNQPLIWNTKNVNDEFATRNYISDPGFTHILGFISPPLKDSNDKFSRSSYEARSGIEKAFDDVLQGKNGVLRTEVRANLESSSAKQVEKATSGNDLLLSIDAEIQHQMYKSIESLANKVGFARGSGAIMDIETGELIALTNYPEYSRDFNNQSEEQPYINLFTNGLFTPGSIVKPFVALSALNEGVVSEHKSILSTKTIIIPNRYNPDLPTYFSDWKAHGYVDVRDALAVSSNAYFYAVGGGLYDQKGVGITKLNQYLSAFKLDEPAGIKGFDAAGGVVPSPSWKALNYPNDPTWRLGDTFLTAIGQYGWQVTPLQMLRGVGGIASRGVLVEPTLIKDEMVLEEKVDIEISNSVYQIIHEGMRQAVLDGTARGLNVPYVEVAAKTGTAELGVSKENVNSWIMGFWPYHQPKYAFVVMMNEGSRYNLTGATFAMRQLFDWMRDNKIEYLNL